MGLVARVLDSSFWRRDCVDLCSDSRSWIEDVICAVFESIRESSRLSISFIFLVIAVRDLLSFLISVESCEERFGILVCVKRLRSVQRPQRLRNKFGSASGVQ